MENGLPPILTIKQVADYLQVSMPTVRKLVMKQAFPAVKVSKKKIVVPRDKFLSWLNEQADLPLK